MIKLDFLLGERFKVCRFLFRLYAGLTGIATGVAAAFTIPSAQSLVTLSFEDSAARVKAFGAWGACGSSGFV